MFTIYPLTHSQHKMPLMYVELSQSCLEHCVTLADEAKQVAFSYNVCFANL